MGNAARSEPPENGRGMGGHVRKVVSRATPHIHRPRNGFTAPPLVSTRKEVTGKLLMEVSDIDKKLRSAPNPEERKKLRQRLIKGLVPQAPGRMLAEKARSLLFAYWARGGEVEVPYDSHMIDHEMAYEQIVKSLAKIQMLGYDIYGKRVLEMSSGTGTLIKLACNILPPEVVRGITFYANDESPEMMKVGWEKFSKELLNLPAGIECMFADLSDFPIDVEYDTTKIGSTTHLLVNPQLLEVELSQENKKRKNHKNAKRRAIQTAGFDCLKDGGYHIHIEEFPAKISLNESSVVSILFNLIARPLGDPTSLRRIIGSIPEARHFVEFDMDIDGMHGMKTIVYEKDPERIPGRSDTTFPRNGKREYAEAEIAAIEVFDAIDPQFIESYSTEEGIGFIPLESMVLEHADTDKPVSGKHDGIVLSRQFHCNPFHDMPWDKRVGMMEGLIDAIKPGGAIFVSDLFPGPMHNERFRKSHLRELMGEFEDRLMFEGTVRMPLKPEQYQGVYTYMYRKDSY